MFETALVESAGLLRTNNRKPAMISIAAQSLLVAAIVTYPLLYPGILIARHVDIPVAHFLPLPKPPIPVPQLPQVRLQPTVQPINTISAPAPAAPVIHTSPTPEAPPTAPLTFGTTISPAPLPIGTGEYGDTTGPRISVTPGNSHTGTGPGGTGNNPAAKLTTISTGVSAGLLMAPIQPIYPTIAKAAHQSGTVMVEATISATGHIESAHVTSGPTLLQGAALDAVRAARYHPYLLNGQPTEVNATFSIHFTLNE